MPICQGIDTASPEFRAKIQQIVYRMGAKRLMEILEFYAVAVELFGNTAIEELIEEREAKK